MKAGELMTRRIVTVRPGTTLVEAIGLMLERHVSGLPVVNEEGKLVGLLTEGDLLHRVETGTDTVRFGWLYSLFGQGWLAGRYVQTHGRLVRDAMTEDVHTVGPEASAEEVVRIMETRRVRRVPVVEDGRPIGMVSRPDLLRALGAALAREQGVPGEGDGAIRAAILAEMARHEWVAGRQIEVTVKDGVVTLAGAVFDERVRDACRVIVERVPGVKEVRNDLNVLDLNTVLAYGI